jgi:hypothetical protein
VFYKIVYVVQLQHFVEQYTEPIDKSQLVVVAEHKLPEFEQLVELVLGMLSILEHIGLIQHL